MDYIEIDSYRTELNANGAGIVWVSIDGDEDVVGVIKNCQSLSSTEANERALELLRVNGFKLKEKQPTPASKPKREKVMLGLANEYGKVTLKIAQPEKKKVIKGYNLYLKGTNKVVYRLDKFGIYVTENDGKKKTPPVIFSEEDIKCIKNINDFDVKKMDCEFKRAIVNKVAPIKNAK